MVSLMNRNDALYYRICMQQAIPIRYWITPSARALSVTLDGRSYLVDLEPLVLRALALWRSATAAGGQAPACWFERAAASASASLHFLATSNVHFPAAVGLDLTIDSYREQLSPSTYRINFPPPRAQNNLAARRNDFREMSDENYIRVYLFARMLHLVGHALGLDHPGLERSDDIAPRINPARERSVFRTDDLPGDAWTRPHIMTTDTFSYLLELRQELRRPVTLNDIQPSEAENQAVRYYLVHEWECPWPSATRATALRSSAQTCLPRPPGLAAAWIGLLQ
jgi:hypothetical protein